MNKLLRTLWLVLVSARRRPKLSALDVSHTPFRVRLTDIDTLRHMNNGVYLSMADLGRMDLMIRSGMFDRLRAKGWYPVVANQTVSYRKSLDLWTKYDLQTKLLGVDDRGVYVQQRFVVDGEIHAEMIMRARFLKRTGGTVSIEELKEAAGVDVSVLEIPEWVLRWAADAALPSTRQPAPSEW